jgi:hypothetical protein
MMVRRIFYLAAVCCVYSFILLGEKLNAIDKNNVSVVSTQDTKNSFVSYVTINNVNYLLKQKKDIKKQLAVVRDALAAYIAKCLGNIAHEVEIIAYQENFPGKVKNNLPATLHTIAPGQTVRVQRDIPYNALRLRQFWANAKTYREKGFTREIITHMTWHWQLPIIVALDLVIGNSDRHGANLFYDPINDRFCAIDMDDTFNKDLCLFTCKKLQFMIREEHVIFTEQELRALARLKDTLQLLVRHHKPRNTIKKLRLFARKAGFVKGSKLYSASIEKKLLHYEGMIFSTYHNACELIVLLDTIIASGGGIGGDACFTR